MQPASAHDLLKKARADLAKRSDTPDLDAQLLLMHASGKTKTWLWTYPEIPLDETVRRDFLDLLDRYLRGEALPYLLGSWEFYGRSFHVTPAVLIPRPETELLIETALQRLNQVESAAVLDVGTGSGCIAITIAKEKPAAAVIGVDVSLAVLKIARINTHRHDVSRQVRLVCSDLTAAVTGYYDLVCANLPYIPTRKLADLAVAASEPHLALDGGSDGLLPIRRLIADLKRLLWPGGWVLLEIEAQQGPVVQQLLEAKYPGRQARVRKDLAGHDRLVEMQF